MVMLPSPRLNRTSRNSCSSVWRNMNKLLHIETHNLSFNDACLPRLPRSAPPVMGCQLDFDDTGGFEVSKAVYSEAHRERLRHNTQV